MLQVKLEIAVVYNYLTESRITDTAPFFYCLLRLLVVWHVMTNDDKRNFFFCKRQLRLCSRQMSCLIDLDMKATNQICASMKNV